MLKGKLRLTWVTLLSLVLLSWSPQAFSDQKLSQSRPAAAAAAMSSPAAAAADATAHSGKQESLIFSGEFSFLSDPIPVEKKEEFIEFFRKEECRNIIYSGAGKRHLKEVPLEGEVLNWWKEVGPSFNPPILPRKESKAVEADAEIHFPGLTLTTMAYSGVTLHLSSSGLPEYTSVVLAEKQSIKGLGPIEWIFNQLTGNANKPKDRFLKSENRFRSNVSITEVKGSYAILFNADFKIFVHFPRKLLRILPTSKAKVEEQGSSTVLKMLSKEAESAVRGIYTAFFDDRPLDHPTTAAQSTCTKI